MISNIKNSIFLIRGLFGAIFEEQIRILRIVLRKKK